MHYGGSMLGIKPYKTIMITIKLENYKGRYFMQMKNKRQPNVKNVKNLHHARHYSFHQVSNKLQSAVVTGLSLVPLTKKFRLSATTSPSLMNQHTRCASGIMSRDRATENVRWRDVISSTFPVTMLPPAVI